MASETQIAANRRNAAKSTGPRTRHGIAASSRNALKHGLNSRNLLTSEPALTEILRIEANYHPEFSPATPDEGALVRALAEAHWLHDYTTQLERITLKKSQNEPNLADPTCGPLAKILAASNRAIRQYCQTLDRLNRLRAKNSQNEPNSR